MLSSYIATVRLLNRDVRLVFATYAVFGFAWGGLYTLLFNLYLLRLGYDTDFIGVVNGISRFAFALGGLPAGMLGMRFGARRMILLGVSVIAAGLVALPLGEYVPVDWRAGWIIVTLSGAFAGGSLFFVNMTPYLMTVVTEQERAHVFSFNSVLFPACGFLGSLIGGLLPGLVADLLGSTVEDPAAYRWPLLLAGALFWLCLPPLLATQRTESTSTTSQTDDSGPPIALLLVLSAVLFLVNAPQGAAMAFFNVYLDAELSVSTELIGVIGAAGQIVAVPAAATMPGLAARWGQLATYAMVGLVGCIWLVPLALVPHWSVAAVTFVAISAYGAIRGPLFTVFSQGIIPARWRSAMSGAASTSLGLSWTLTAGVGGVIIRDYGYPALFLGASVLGVAGIVLLFVAARMPGQLRDALEASNG